MNKSNINGGTSAPNIADNLGASGSLIFTEFVNEDLISSLNKILGISLNAAHKDSLNKALTYYQAYSSSKEHSRDDTYRKLQKLSDSLNDIIDFFSFPGSESGEIRSVTQRVLTECSKLKKLSKLPNEIEDDFQKHGVDAEDNNLFTLSIFYDDERKSEFLQEAIIYSHAIRRAIDELKKEENNHIGGRPLAKYKNTLLEKLKNTFISALPKNKRHKENTNFEYFYTEICKTLPKDVRPKFGKVGSISKRIKRKKVL